MWKKKIAVLMAAAMITGMSGMTVFAEEQQGGGAPQMEQQLQQAPQGEAPAGMEGQAPQGEVPAGQLPQGEAPAGMESQAPQGEAPAGQPPQMGQQGEAPQNGQQSPQGEMPQAPEGEAPADMRQAPQGEAPQNGQQPPMMGQQPPQAPQGEAPANNGQQSSQGVAPQMEQKRQRRSKMDHGQTPQGDKGRASQNQEHGRPFIDFEACVKDGTISQETYDAIKKYMDENKPERPTAGGEEDSKPEMKDGEKPELPEEGEKPELPEAGEKPEKPDLLKDLLDAEVITQDEYDALAKRSDDVKEGSAQEEKAASAQENKPTAAQEDKSTAAQEDKEADAKDENVAQTDKTT